MYINRIYLKNFRRFKEASFAFREGCTLILGPNAVGKTSILEAIHILIFGRSFRAASLSETILEGENQAAIEANFIKEGVEHTLGLYFNHSERKVSLNRSDAKTLSSLIGLLLGSALLPSDINLISGQPYARRQFLDYLIAQTDPLYFHHLGRYTNSLKNRNALLKKRDFRTIDVFEEEMAKSAEYIAIARNQAVLQLDGLARDQFSLFGTQEEVFSIRYVPHGPKVLSKEAFLEHFQKTRPREAYLGFTMSGPQKDDLAFFLSERECKLFSSEGQKRSAAAALRLASWTHLKNTSFATPFLLVDDAGLGFDRQRKRLFLESLHAKGQVLVTSAEEDLGLNVKDVIKLDF